MIESKGGFYVYDSALALSISYSRSQCTWVTLFQLLKYLKQTGHIHYSDAALYGPDPPLVANSLRRIGATIMVINAHTPKKLPLNFA